jgi:hypothetical protein
MQLPTLMGDFNADGIVDAADYVVWRDSAGSTGSGLAADADGDNLVSQSDYEIWKANFGDHAGGNLGGLSAVAVPEPAALILSACVFASLVVRRFPRREGRAV